MPLRICMVTTFYPPYNFGGDGIHVQRLARALARRGHRVRIVHSRGAYEALRPRGRGRPQQAGEDRPTEGIEVSSPGGPAGRLEPFLVHQAGVPVLTRAWLREALGADREGGFDVVHYHNVSLVGGLGVLAMGTGVKLFTAHEYWLGCPTHLLFRYNRAICTRRTCVRCTLKSGRPPQLWRYFRRRARYLAHVDRIIFPSELTRRVYRELGIERPGLVLRHFLPDDYLATAASTPRDTTQDPYCLYVGRLDAVKGLHTVLPLFAEGRAAVPIRVVGEGPQGDELRAAWGESPHVRFVGHRSGEELHRLYRDATAVILPSAGLETFGQVILEAFAHATPAVSSRNGAGCELIDESGAGFTYESDQELLEGMSRLADARRRDELGARGRAYVEREHRESGFIDQYEALMEACHR